MSKDHFVAQTYLKHWCDPKTNMLHGYSKAADKQFPSFPKDVCHEWNWDTNPRFEDKAAIFVTCNFSGFREWHFEWPLVRTFVRPRYALDDSSESRASPHSRLLCPCMVNVG